MTMTATVQETTTLPSRRQRFVAFCRELISFGLVGGVAFIVDTGVFNALQYAGPRVLEGSPMTAKVISVAVATVVAWAGNRYFTYRHKTSSMNTWVELQAFAIVNVIGLLIGLACLGFSHYVLGAWYDWAATPLADNISANGVGLFLGTAFRFAAYRWWLFSDTKPVKETV